MLPCLTTFAVAAAVAAIGSAPSTTVEFLFMDRADLVDPWGLRESRLLTFYTHLLYSRTDNSMLSSRLPAASLLGSRAEGSDAVTERLVLPTPAGLRHGSAGDRSAAFSERPFAV